MSQIELRLAIGQNSAYYNPKYQGIVIEKFDHLGRLTSTKVLGCSFETAMSILK